MKSKGTYTLDDLEIGYELYWDDGDHFMAPEFELNYTSITLNGMDIFVFYINFLAEQLYDQVLEYANENKYQ